MSGFRQSSIVPAPGKLTFLSFKNRVSDSKQLAMLPAQIGRLCRLHKAFFSRTFKDVNMIETKDVGLYRDSRPCCPVDFRSLKIYSRSKISTL
ncbi:hypothetical protein BYT27DRAFT_7185198 [Phlegmacium glaucopus]|nr:hypothetical protein BYT27DRAFT_7185437 [Phlegmacium glaucopus]KAF8810943.1 hypothetical protein BYT27DRAFT_7185198 [Phlegmacium glaucopus]